MAGQNPRDVPSPPPPDPGALCPWCSAPVASPDDVTCRACGATLRGDAAIEIPGVTEIDAAHASRAFAPRKVRRTFGSLFIGGDEGIPPPSEAELPALALPDAEVRREMLRLQLEAELADLNARAAALAAEQGIPMPVLPGAPEPSEAAPPPGTPSEPGAASERAAREPDPSIRPDASSRDAPAQATAGADRPMPAEPGPADQGAPEAASRPRRPRTRRAKP
jgi:hypothetical protein